MVLTKQSVDGIQLQGGTILGTSRGGANIKCARLRGDVGGAEPPTIGPDGAGCQGSCGPSRQCPADGSPPG